MANPKGGPFTEISLYIIPANIAGRRVKIHTDVVDSDIPLLLSLKSMKQAKVKLNLKDVTAEIFGKEVVLNHTSLGHYCIPIDNHQEIQVCAVHLDKLN